MAGIEAYGAYIPRTRLQRRAIFEAHRWFAPGLKSLAKGERAAAGWDEDAVTMAVEAARDCLGDRDRNVIRSVMLASTSFPFADRQNAGIAKEALNLPDNVATLDVSGSQKAGTSALLQACQSVDAISAPVLVVASDRRKFRPASEDEMVCGDAAASFLIGPGDGLAKFIGSRSVAIDFVDHFRAQSSDFDYGWEARWIRDEGYSKLLQGAVRDALGAFGLNGEQVAHLIVGLPAKNAGVALGKSLGIPANAVRDDLLETVGISGCAQPLVMLAHALESAKPGDKLVVVGFGQGVDVLLFEATAAVTHTKPVKGVSGGLAGGAKDENYIKYLVLAGHLKLELGKRAELEQKPALAALYRNRKSVLALIGGKCTRTGTIQFPRSEISVNQNDAAIGTQEDYPLAERVAKIVTFTADNLTYTPEPPGYYGMVEFEGGGRMMAEFADVDTEAIFVGAQMRMMFRIKAIDERSGFQKYFWKAAPANQRI